MIEDAKKLRDEVILDVDRWVGQAVSAYEHQMHPVVCTGCRLGHCCQQPVLTTPLDALGIARRLDNTRQLRRQLRRVGEEHEQAMEWGTAEDHKHPCPFLDGACRCTVYAERPVFCRVYLALGTREACIPYCDRTDGRRPLVELVDHDEPVVWITVAAAKLAQSHGWPPGFYARALPTMVAVFLEAETQGASRYWDVVRGGAMMPQDRARRVFEKTLRVAR
jgi:Fe-S-cluster containining protein